MTTKTNVCVIMVKLSIYRILLVTFILSVTGIASILIVFLESHPYFSPIRTSVLPEGWVNDSTYTSNNFTVVSGKRISRTVVFGGDGVIPIIHLRLNPLIVTRIGEVEIRVNSIFLGNILINNNVVPIDSSITSCCSYPLIVGGRENIIEIKSKTFEGILQYVIVIPQR